MRMMDEAKIQLSALETELVNNTDWILTKHHVIEKVYALFGLISQRMKNEIAGPDLLLPQEILHRSAKISRGENYDRLPFVILDYPNYFERNNIFAVRTMFWWGNFFSITLHASGALKERFTGGNLNLLPCLVKKDFSICVNGDEWQHHFSEENYLPASAIGEARYAEILGKPFFKIAKRLPLQKWDEAPGFIIENFKAILELLQANYQGGKAGL